MQKNRSERLTYSQKNANDKAWYKSKADEIDNSHIGSIYKFGDISRFRSMKVNYDLFNDKLDLREFEYVCKPFGSGLGELPAKMVNKDIVSGKIKAILGMEMKRPFSWNVIATNPEATTRKEQEEFKRVQDYVVSEIVKPIRVQIEQRHAEENKGKQLNEDEIKSIQQKIEEELKTQTPDEVKKYMIREHQDPAEILSQQLLEYLIQKCDLKRKFNDAFKHGTLSALGIMYVGILNGEPEALLVNPLRFNFDAAPDLQFVEDGEYASCEYKMTPSEVVKYFGDVLTDKQIDRIYEAWNIGAGSINENDLFARYELSNDFQHDNSLAISVVHCVWKSLRKIGFLTYKDEEGILHEKLQVDENYTLNKDAGDIKIEWEWIPEDYETWKIRTIDPVYIKMQPIPGQIKDPENLYNCKLPYYGVIYDNMNSEPTSLMDRLKAYQYYYNIIYYRIELLLASDKGKKVLMNINAVPDKLGISLEKWEYYVEATPYMWYDPDAEGAGGSLDANNVAKVVDLSLISDIDKYINIAEAIRQQAGRSVGITDQVEGQTGPNESVGNARQNLIQSSNILEPYFDLHNYFKRNVLQALIETAKIAYSNTNKTKISYTLDDMSRRMIDLDIGLLDNSTLGIFVANSAKAEESKDLIRQLSHAAMQNQKAELSDVMSIIRQESIVEAEETLKLAEIKRMEFEQNQNQSQIESQERMAEEARQFAREKHEMDKEIIILKEEERRKTVITQNAILAASFNPDQDVDNDGINDFMEVAKYGLDAEVKKSKQQLEREKFEHQKITDAKKMEQTDEKLRIDKKKINKINKT